VLTQSLDELAYWRKLKEREPQLVTICHGLKLPAKDGRMRYADCVNTRNAFSLILPEKNLKKILRCNYPYSFKDFIFQKMIIMSDNIF